jgi:hypothetical protein
MKTNEIVHQIILYLSKNQFPIFLTTFAGAGFSEADVFGIRKNGYMYEFEIKRSRSDFFNDFKNKTYKHKLLQEGKAVSIHDEWERGQRTGGTYEVISIPNKFFFVCENGLISPDEVPEYAGLIYVDFSGLDYKKNAKFIHKNKANAMIYKRVANILSQRMVYGNSYASFLLKSK